MIFKCQVKVNKEHLENALTTFDPPEVNFNMYALFNFVLELIADTCLHRASKDKLQNKNSLALRL